MKLVIDKTQQVELILGGVGFNNKTNFSDNATIRENKIYGVTVSGRTDVSVSTSGATVVTDAMLAGINLTLVDDNNKEILPNYPLRLLVPTLNDGLIQSFRARKIDLQKSFVTITDTSLSITTGLSIIFNFLYE